ncbi:hypothetical protein K2X85_02230 [bacterium]|nr:hypothetical protein [bacterium]
MTDSEMARVPDPPEPLPKPKGHRLRLEALEGLSIGVPARIKALAETDGPIVLQPGPCQSDHPLSSVIDSIAGEKRPDQVTQDPSFPTSDLGKEWR